MAGRKRTKNWTLILIADDGPVGSFQMSGRLFRILVLLVLGAFLVAAAFLYSLGADQSRVRQVLQQELQASDDALHVMSARNAALLQKVKDLERSLAATLDETAGRIEPAADGKADVMPSDLAVENFEVWRNPPDTTVRFRFLLRNTSSSNASLSGFLFVLYRPDYLDATTWSIFPSVPMTGWLPDRICSGDPFNIARFKTVRGYFTDVRPAGPCTVSVWAFSEEGELLFFKDYFLEE